MFISNRSFRILLLIKGAALVGLPFRTDAEETLEQLRARSINVYWTDLAPRLNVL